MQPCCIPLTLRTGHIVVVVVITHGLFTDPPRLCRHSKFAIYLPTHCLYLHSQLPSFDCPSTRLPAFALPSCWCLILGYRYIVILVVVHTAWPCTLLALLLQFKHSNVSRFNALVTARHFAYALRTPTAARLALARLAEWLAVATRADETTGRMN